MAQSSGLHVIWVPVAAATHLAMYPYTHAVCIISDMPYRSSSPSVIRMPFISPTIICLMYHDSRERDRQGVSPPEPDVSEDAADPENAEKTC